MHRYDAATGNSVFLYADQPDFLDVSRLYETGFPQKVSVKKGLGKDIDGLAYECCLCL